VADPVVSDTSRNSCALNISRTTSPYHRVLTKCLPPLNKPHVVCPGHPRARRSTGANTVISSFTRHVDWPFRCMGCNAVCGMPPGLIVSSAAAMFLEAGKLCESTNRASPPWRLKCWSHRPHLEGVLNRRLRLLPLRLSVLRNDFGKSAGKIYSESLAVSRERFYQPKFFDSASPAYVPATPRAGNVLSFREQALIENE